MSASLPCGERAVRCLLGEEIDRLPFGVGLGWLSWGDALEGWRRKSWIAFDRYIPGFDHLIPPMSPGNATGLRSNA